jgi:hypothetical protein
MLLYISPNTLTVPAIFLAKVLFELLFLSTNDEVMGETKQHRQKYEQPPGID